MDLSFGNKLNGTWLIDCGSDCDGDARVTRVHEEAALLAEVEMADTGDVVDRELFGEAP